MESRGLHYPSALVRKYPLICIYNNRRFGIAGQVPFFKTRVQFAPQSLRTYV
jgi:hypothetical protein